MTLKERAKPEIIKGSRKRRIAAGCGMQVQDVNRLLKQFGRHAAHDEEDASRKAADEDDARDERDDAAKASRSLKTRA